MDATQTLRRFNRAYTQRIGVLSESYLGTGRPLGPSRLLFEVPASGIGVIELRRKLGLDSGYLSRLLRQLESEDLVTVTPDPEDRRRRRVRLTARGARTQRTLEERSQQLAADIIEPLSPHLREELSAALSTAERILRSATVEFNRVSPDSPEASQALASYFAELDRRFDTGFDTSAAGAGSDADAMNPPTGVFLTIDTDGDVVGCGGVQRLDEQTAEIKRMWVHPEWRGLGLGGRLLRRLEDEAEHLGQRRIVLDTNGSLTEAIALYERVGYRPIERYNDNPYAQHWFEKTLIEPPPL